jgi:hypothetical protein
MQNIGERWKIACFLLVNGDESAKEAFAQKVNHG